MNSRRCMVALRRGPQSTTSLDHKRACASQRNLPAYVGSGSFATGPSPHPVELCLICPEKRKSNQGLGICHDGLRRVDDAAISFCTGVLEQPIWQSGLNGARSSCCSMPFPGQPVAAGEARLPGWPLCCTTRLTSCGCHVPPRGVSGGEQRDSPQETQVPN